MIKGMLVGAIIGALFAFGKAGNVEQMVLLQKIAEGMGIGAIVGILFLWWL